MRQFALAVVLTVSPLLPFGFSAPAASTALGGKACQVAESCVPTPGLPELVMGSESSPVPAGLRLTAAQIDKLYELDCTLRQRVFELDAQRRELPPARDAARATDGKAHELPELVADFLARATRDAAIVIDAEQAIEFRLARKDGPADPSDGKHCALCVAVRRGMERPFGWSPGEFGELDVEQAKLAQRIADARQEVRRAWANGVASTLDAAQLERLRRAQMSWLKSTLAESVKTGMTSLGAATCSSCKAEVQVKCEFCGIVEKALERARSSL